MVQKNLDFNFLSAEKCQKTRDNMVLAVRHFLLAALLFCAFGCGNSKKASFIELEATSKLLDPVRQAIAGELRSGFGTPNDLVAWKALPVDFGELTGRLVANDVDYVVRLDGKNFLSKKSVEWVPGTTISAGASKLALVESYNSTFGDIKVSEKSIFAEGDNVTVCGSVLAWGRNLYHRHCMHCHGVTGDGNGSTAKYFSVAPRDYRRGIFKFTSTGALIRANRADLHRIVKLGVPGTYMPSFMLIGDAEIEALVEYVRWLSMRGEIERLLTIEYRDDFSKGPDEASREKEFKASAERDIGSKTQGIVVDLDSDWMTAEEPESLVTPKSRRVEATVESVARGKVIFLGAKASCVKCHGEMGKGNGQSTEDFNDIPGEPGKKADRPGLFDNWGNIVRPRDLTSGQYRGGRRPIDIYRRIFAGIKGTPMQGFGGSLSDEEIWDVTNYVLALPYQ